MPTVMRKMAAIGLVQGIVLAVLQYFVAYHQWDVAHTSLLLALLYATVAAPVAWYLTDAIPGLTPRRRGVTVIVLAVVLAALGAYEGWAGADPNGGPRVGPTTLACVMLGFIGVPLLAHAGRHGGRGWRWDYAALFQTTWRNAFVVIVAGTLTGILWAVLLAGGGLMKAIGISQISNLLGLPWVALPITGVAFACAVAVALTRTDTIVALRRFWLSMNQAFLPLVLGFSTMWAIALPFTGTDALMQTRMAGMALLWFAALAVNFVNAAYQDGQAPTPFTPWLRRAISIAWLTMLLVVAVAGVAIYQRVNQYGWTADRVWSVFVLLIAAGYTIGYALSVRPRGTWMWSIGPTNVVMAIVLCLGLIALSTPLVDARRISVASQVDRLLTGKTAFDNFDFYYLNSQSGIYGRRALQRFADGIPGHPESERWAQAARDAQVASVGYTEPLDQPDDALRAAWRTLPDNATLPPGVVDALLAHLRSGAVSLNDEPCLRAQPWSQTNSQFHSQCALWMVDLDADGAQELVLIVDQYWNRTGLVYRWTPDTKRLVREAKILDLTPEWIAAVAAGNVEVTPSRWRDVNAGGLNGRVLQAD